MTTLAGVGAAAHELDLDWVTGYLAVGGRVPVEGIPRLAREHRVRSVVDVRLEDCDDESVLRVHGLSLLHLPTLDRCPLSQAMLDDGVRWAVGAILRGERVLIHCEHGIGRSALLALCVLVALGDNPGAALARAKSARAKVSPSPEQLEAYINWCERWRERHAPFLAVPCFEELGAIAWRASPPG